LEQIDLLQKGEFPDWLLLACINDLRVREISQYESNGGRINEMNEAFCLGTPWKDKVNLHDNMEKITKQQIMDFAKKYFGRNNYVIVYKRQGKQTDFDKVKKPKATPIKINRDDKSDFVKMIELRKVTPIEPVFVDFQKDIKTYDAQNGVKMYYTKNNENELFSLNYVVDMGVFQDKYLNMAADYLEYLGTDKYTPEQVKEEFYKLGCKFGMGADGDRSYISISGLSKNMEEAMTLFEHILHNAKPNQEALDNLVKDVFNERENAKSNQNAIFSYLVTYGIYGAGSKSPLLSTQLTTKELSSLKPEMLINKLKEWVNYKQFAIYYGPESQEKVIGLINKIHDPKNLKDVLPEKHFPEDVPQKDRVYVVHYEIPNQTYFISFSFGGKYQKELSPRIRLYNEYFGGGMSSIVFQEMRESRALAYHAMSQYQTPDDLHELYKNLCLIVCGTDKLKESVETFNGLLLDMPENDAAFNLAKNTAVDYYRTQRTKPKSLVWSYLSWQKLGLTEDPRKANFNNLQKLNFSDIKQFHTDNVSKKPRTFIVFGNTKEIDMDYIKTIGKVKVLKLEEIFGF
jgi:predicted Zn-dependent peptidase